MSTKSSPRLKPNDRSDPATYIKTKASRPISFDWSDPDAVFISDPYWSFVDKKTNKEIVLVYREPIIQVKYAETTRPSKVMKQQPLELVVNSRSERLCSTFSQSQKCLTCDFPAHSNWAKLFNKPICCNWCFTTINAKPGEEGFGKHGHGPSCENKKKCW